MTSISSTYQPETLQSLTQRKGRVMELDNQGNPVDFNVVMVEWLGTAEASELLNVSRQYIVQVLISRKRLRAYRHGTERRGEWYIDPQSIEDYKAGKL